MSIKQFAESLKNLKPEPIPQKDEPRLHEQIDDLDDEIAMIDAKLASKAQQGDGQ